MKILPMQPVEDFLREYFQSRTKLMRESCGVWETHTQRFFALGYQPYSRMKWVADSEAESIISVSSADDSVDAITTGCGGGWRLRYRLSAMDDTWRITRMQLECGICHGSGKAKDGKSDCRLCDGAGWKGVD